MKKVQIGDTVTVHYTGRLEDGTIFGTSRQEGRTPITEQLGQGRLIKGFEDGLVDMSEGETKTVEIESSQAYGDVNPQLMVEVPKGQLPENVQIGETLQATGPQGPVMVTVREIRENSVIVDANHPLAGKKLIFDLELVSIG